MGDGTGGGVGLEVGVEGGSGDEEDTQDVDFDEGVENGTKCRRTVLSS